MFFEFASNTGMPANSPSSTIFVRGRHVGAAIAGDQDRILRVEQTFGERRDERRIGAAAGKRAEAVGGIAVNLVDVPMLGQRLALHHQIDRAARLALHDRMRAPQHLLDDDAGRKRPFPLGVGAHQAALIERLLHEMHVGVARADQFAVGGVRRFAGHQQHRQSAAIGIVHAVGGVGGADIDVHQNALTAPGHQRIACGHVCGGVLVRTAHHFRHHLAALAAMRHLLDDRRVIGAEITEQILDADLVQAFEKIIGRGEIGNVGVAPDRCIHCCSRSFPGFSFTL